jgi:hypothetical protein
MKEHNSVSLLKLKLNLEAEIRELKLFISTSKPEHVLFYGQALMRSYRMYLIVLGMVNIYN